MWQNPAMFLVDGNSAEDLYGATGREASATGLGLDGRGQGRQGPWPRLGFLGTS